MNLIGFVIMGIDKNKVINQQYRIPEKRLFLTVWLGGALGVLLAMKFFRHKTLHNSFRFGVPAIMVVTYSVAFVLKRFLDGYLVPTISAVFNRASEGGILFYLLYPFIFDQRTTGSSMYWSSFWTVIAIIFLLSITYYFLSKRIALPYRISLILVNAYSLLLLVYKILIGLMNSDSFLHTIILLALPLSINFMRGFVLGAINGAKEEFSKGKDLPGTDIAAHDPVVENDSTNKSGKENEKDGFFLNVMPEDIIKNPAKYGFIPSGSERIEDTNNPIQNEEKVDFPLFGATFYQRENLPRICQINIDKAFYNAGISVGSEIISVKDIKNDREVEIKNLNDLMIVYNDIRSRDELLIRTLEGRGTFNESIKNIYSKLESHINLVKS
jgi:uncharacterized membrane protein YsdA (DUF1294 family)